MPFSNPKQPIAVFLNIKRRQGANAARAFAEKHRKDMGKSGGAKPYRARKRSK